MPNNQPIECRQMVAPQTSESYARCVVGGCVREARHTHTSGDQEQWDDCGWGRTDGRGANTNRWKRNARDKIPKGDLINYTFPERQLNATGRQMVDRHAQQFQEEDILMEDWGTTTTTIVEKESKSS